MQAPDVGLHGGLLAGFLHLLVDLFLDGRDDFLDPSRGTYVRALGEYAGGLLGGQNEFSRWTVDASWYRAALGELVVAARVRTGLIVPVGRGLGLAEDSLRVAKIPSEERFRLIVERDREIAAFEPVEFWRIVAELEKQGQLDNTLLFFLQDNGGCAEGGMWGFSREGEPIGALCAIDGAPRTWPPLTPPPAIQTVKQCGL